MALLELDANLWLNLAIHESIDEILLDIIRRSRWHDEATRVRERAWSLGEAYSAATAARRFELCSLGESLSRVRSPEAVTLVRAVIALRLQAISNVQCLGFELERASLDEVYAIGQQCRSDSHTLGTELLCHPEGHSLYRGMLLRAGLAPEGPVGIPHCGGVPEGVCPTASERADFRAAALFGASQRAPWPDRVAILEEAQSTAQNAALVAMAVGDLAAIAAFEDDRTSCMSRLGNQWARSCHRVAASISGRTEAATHAIVPEDPALASVAAEMACRAGVADACALAGSFAAQGLGRHADPFVAADFHADACSAGIGASCYAAGAVIREHAPERREEIAEWFEQGCRLHHVDACAWYGYAAENGEGVTADIGSAMTAFLTACELGHGWSCGRLAEGSIVGPFAADDTVARALAQRGCELGHQPSCHIGREIAVDSDGFRECLPSEALAFGPVYGRLADRIPPAYGFSHDAFLVRSGCRRNATENLWLLEARGEWVVLGAAVAAWFFNEVTGRNASSTYAATLRVMIDQNGNIIDEEIVEPNGTLGYMSMVGTVLVMGATISNWVNETALRGEVAPLDLSLLNSRRALSISDVARFADSNAAAGNGRSVRVVSGDQRGVASADSTAGTRFQITEAGDNGWSDLFVVTCNHDPNRTLSFSVSKANGPVYLRELSGYNLIRVRSIESQATAFCD